MPDQFEVVGVVNADAAGAIGSDDEDQIIFVEHDDPSERLIAQPKDGDPS